MDIILKKNEAEINENVAKGLLVIFGCILLVAVLCWLSVFEIYFDMTVVMLLIALLTLVIPAVIILKFHFYNGIMKYLVVTGTAIMAETAYVLFTFQAVIIFVVPTIIAGFYLSKRLLYYSGIISVFRLLVGGYTNMQIADQLCLSNGTVKNYISTIYEKIGTKERNALIMKYSRFVKEND